MHIVLSCWSVDFVVVARRFADRLLKPRSSSDSTGSVSVRAYMTGMGTGPSPLFSRDLRKWIIFGRIPAAATIAAGKAQVS